MLSTNINSTSELISVAIAAEREAVQRYSELATKMHECGNNEAATLFERMRDEERIHEQKLVDWAAQTGLEISSDIEPVNWEFPEVATIYDAEAKDPDQCTPYKAFAFAVHNEERAFHFYSYVAANSKDPDVCEFAEILAHEELGHAALLRTLRRREWHKERNKNGAEPSVRSTIIHNTADLLTISLFIEKSLLDLIEQFAARFPDLRTAEVITRKILSINEEKLPQDEPPGGDVTSILESLKSWQQDNPVITDNTSAALRRLCSDSDYRFTFYDSIVASTQNEEVMFLAQELCSLALERISELRKLNCNSFDQVDEHT